MRVSSLATARAGLWREVIGPEILVAGQPLWARHRALSRRNENSRFSCKIQRRHFDEGRLYSWAAFTDVGRTPLAGAVVETRNEPAQDRR